MDLIRIGIITTSDRAFKGIYEAVSWSKIQELFQSYLLNPCSFESRVIPDEQEIIERVMKEMAEDFNCDIIITTGGTGPALRDVTVDATEAVCHRLLPGFGELMRQTSLKYVPTAILSRQTAGIYGSTLIVNLPGKPNSIEQCLEAVFPAMPYCVDLIGGAFMEVNEQVINAFRPSS